MKERFPDINWHCDNCGDLLNTQPQFNDHHYVWKCTECGYKNSISSDAIRYGNNKVMEALQKITCFISSACIIFSIFFITTSFFSIAMALLAIYLFFDIIALFLDRNYVKERLDMSWLRYIVTTPFVYFIEDLRRPFVKVRNAFTSVIRYKKTGRKPFLVVNIIAGIIYFPLIVFLVISLLLITSQLIS